ncbi:MAG: response regulator transcription factor [Chloroflexi bacterium]|nr:response regulator transcription factor [Chloroflexota bacterium]
MKVLIADDHAVVRRGVREILEEAPLGLFVDETASAGETLKAVRDKAYDIVLLDISFPDGSGLDVLRQIRAQCPYTRVLLLSMYPEEQYAQRALRLGASGYLTKDSAPNELVNAIQKVAVGGKYITQALAERLADEISMQVEKAPHETLSDREFQVLTRLGAGKSIHAIAAELSLSPKTVSTYRSRLLEKLKLKTPADIIHYVIENRLGD